MNRLIPPPLRAACRRLAWNAIGLTSVTASGMPLRIASASDWHIFNEIFVRGEYDRAIMASLARAAGEWNVVDLGANVGFFSLRALDLLRASGRGDLAVHIVAVEGSPTVARELAARLDHAGVTTAVTPVTGLIGRRSGDTVLCEAEFAARSSIMRQEAGSSERVPFLDLHSVIRREAAIDLLKCDIEGAEELFLENYPDLLRVVRVAVFELHDRLCDTRRCLDLLAAAGLVVQDHRVMADSTSIVTLARHGRTNQSQDPPATSVTEPAFHL